MDQAERNDRNERKKQLIAEGALHRAAIRAERHATSQALQPRNLVGGVLQQVVATGLSILRNKAGAAETEAVAGQRVEGTPDLPGSWVTALSTALPGTLPVALPLLIRAATLFVRLGRSASVKLSRKTLLRAVLLAGAAAAVTGVAAMRKRKVASVSAPDSLRGTPPTAHDKHSSHQFNL